MKTSILVWIVVALVVIAGAWYWLSMSSASPATSATGPSNAMGINGSPNQGNLGQPDNGQPQQPQDNDSGTAKADLNIASGASVGQYLTADNYLTQQNDMTLYTFSKDKAGTTTCYAKCASNWPPLGVKSLLGLSVATGINARDLGTVVRPDGLQLTYKGMPLYFYVGDKTAGDTNGDGFGGVWHVAKP